MSKYKKKRIYNQSKSGSQGIVGDVRENDESDGEMKLEKLQHQIEVH